MSSSDQIATSLMEPFAAIDFETATSDRNSACAVGAVVFEDGAPTKRLRLLIRPPDNRYDAFNTMIHGIGPSDTRNSPQFPEAWQQVASMLGGRTVIAHNTAFDISVLRHSGEHYGYEPDPFPFACTYRIARSVMPDAGSWTLPAMADEFGIPLAHHDPLSDAEAAGVLWVALAERFGVTHSELLGQHGYRLGYCHLSSYKPFSNATPSSSLGSFSAKDFTPQTEPDPEGPLFSRRIVFTGALACMPTDLRKVGASGLSSKHRKALDFAAADSGIRSSTARGVPSRSRRRGRTIAVGKQAHQLPSRGNNRPAQGRCVRSELKAPKGPGFRRGRQRHPDHQRGPVRMPARRHPPLTRHHPKRPDGYSGL